ncbi:MAG: tRNA (guanosine(46)-N7)-methyltransferase TrmB, partial [Oscillospiraceae bacterium]|nr:tRNA (guanosine(46)-N7)-methyltransferase TrmB [Oscillospiraceae bacterium]
MRIRTKPWAKPELAVCPHFTEDPASLKGKWAEKYARKQPFHIEVGCGKGGFIAQIAPAHPEINYLALDIKREMVAFAR